ncbi:MAG: UDP-N-acetylmuramoyl-L-alanine--D-glutamate ligase [Dehalococcoidales bacterium]|nr:UDP-N-acetylmuramoyl-L-alanine--D-glutamate ligase [Dehalococcoidales bacterium]
MDLARDLANKKITLIGLGTRTNVALARFLVGRGARVTISDRKTAAQLQQEIALLGELPVQLSLGANRVDDTVTADAVFVTPGASRDIPAVVAAVEKGVPVSSEIELLFELCPAPIVGITGSSGKSTTTTLVGEILKASGRRVWVGGNLGFPLIDRMDDMTPSDLVVLELSSFQLEMMRRSPHVAAILNITPNHLDRHPSMEHYAESKRNIVRFQSADDWAILGYANDITREYGRTCTARRLYFGVDPVPGEGAFVEKDAVQLRLDGRVEPVVEVGEILLRGRHNLENVTAAVAITTAAGAPARAMRAAIASFRGIEHRQELVCERDGVRFYNDSIATAPERTLAALRAFPEPMVLLAGGRDKHLPLDELAREIKDRVHTLVLFGEGANLLQAAMAKVGTPPPEIVRCENLAEAVPIAARAARPGDIVLLSPAFTSYDQFRDFEERGREFKRLVREICTEPSEVERGV